MTEAKGYDRILGVIRAAKGALRRGEVLYGLGRTLAVAGLSVVILAAVDNLFRLPASLRVTLLLGAAALSAWVLIREVIRPASREISDDAVAVRMEDAAGVSDNNLINALQLGRDRKATGLSGAIIRSVVARGSQAAGRLSPGRVVDVRRVGRSLAIGGAMLAVLLAYAMLLPDHFGNAVKRYASPGTYVPPVSSTRLVVAPGDAAVVSGNSLGVRIVEAEPVPSSARILVEMEGEFHPSEMRFDGQSYTFDFASVDEGFSYRVEAGDASTPVYRVTVVEPPAVEHLTLTFHYPDYLGFPVRTEEDASGEIRAPVGTRVELVAKLSRAVASAEIRFGSGDGRSLLPAGERTSGGEYEAVRGEIEVTRSDTWSIALTTGDALGNRDPVSHRITALPDEPPVVEILAPAKNLTLTLPAKVDVTVRARDDYGLSEIALLARRGDGGDVQALGTFSVEGEPERVVRKAIELAEGALVAGDVLAYRAEARDRGGNVGRSREYTIRIQSPKERVNDAETALADLATRLRDLLEREQGILRDTVALRGGLAEGSVRLAALPPRSTSLADSQGRLGAEMVTVAGTVPTEVAALAEVRGALLGLAMNDVMEAVRRLQDSRSRGKMTDATRDLDAAEEVERGIVAKLEALLGKVEGMLKNLEARGEEWLDEKMDEGDPNAALKDAIARLKKFIREQEDVIEQTRALEKKDVDDFTEGDEKLLEKLAAQESDLARFLEDLKDDLSKVPDQDFANPQILKELIEAYSEVEMAAGALQKKSIELAVPMEQSGLELAEGLTENIEKWLPDEPDRIKWNMEEFDGEYPDVPMAELPEQLEDLIGELLEQEEDLGEEFDDVTSGWADSLDKGAGWGVADGPISNMSAQGKTGNTLPSSAEIGGRSGEGRTGRSHGEMVEGEATGKGGRKTPTRLTPDAWEGKSVKDSSKDPLGGATGGGKLAGGAAEGLAGPVPPEVKQDLGRLQGKQTSIRQKAEELDRALKKLAYPDEKLERSVVLMKEMEEALKKGNVSGFSRRHPVLLDQMKEGQRVLRDHAAVLRDRSRAVPKELLEEVESVDLSSLPEGYRDLLREYYKILSRGGSK